MDALTNGKRTPGWHTSHGTYIAGRAAIDGVDVLAIEMDRKWGVDRLRLLVSRETRERFDRQRHKFSTAILMGDLIDVQREGSRMEVAWRFADQEASTLQAVPLYEDVWEVALPDGSVAVIVQDTPQAHAVLASGRQIAVYTLDEIANLLHHYQTIKACKLTFPGATVTATRLPGDPLRDLPAGNLDDPLPEDSLEHLGGN